MSRRQTQITFVQKRRALGKHPALSSPAYELIHIADACFDIAVEAIRRIIGPVLDSTVPDSAPLSLHEPLREAAMQYMRVTTEGIREKEQFAYYREEWLHRLGLTAEGAGDTGFAGDSQVCGDQSLHRFKIGCDTCSVRRTAKEIGQVPLQNWIGVYEEKSDGARFGHRRGETMTKTGDLVLGDMHLPFSVECRTGYDHVVWFLPRTLFEPHLPAATPWHCLRLERNRGVVAVIRSYVRALDEQLDTLDAAELVAIADNFSRLLAIACGAAAREHRDAVEAGQLTAVKQYISRNLSNSDLSPASVAAAMKISLRQLHRLFEPTGASFTQYVVSRRLDECHARLAEPGGDHRSIADLAFAWGFNSLPTFYRSFSKRYGMSPRDLQASLRAG